MTPLRKLLITSLAAGLIAPELIPSVAGAQKTAARVAAPEWTSVDSAFGRKGAPQPGNVIRYGFPRADLAVTIGGLRVLPTLALGSWVAFQRIENGRSMMMGDLVLLESEVAPVMAILQKGGIEQTALHNHLLGESPHVMYMHVSAQGKAPDLARTVRTALATTATPLQPPSPAQPSVFSLDTVALHRTLRVAGKVNGGAYQISVPRRETIRAMGHVIPPSLGVATAINFQPTGEARAAIAGDFVLRSSEVNPVIRVLQQNGIRVTAVHSHMLGEEPRLIFMHFWASDDAMKLARGLSAALDSTTSFR